MGVIVIVAELTTDEVAVTRGEDVVVVPGVAGEEVPEGVNIACNVKAAAVCTSLGGATCSKGQLQARIAKIRLMAASIDFKFWVIKICSFLLTAWGTFPSYFIIFSYLASIS